MARHPEATRLNGLLEALDRLRRDVTLPEPCVVTDVRSPPVPVRAPEPGAELSRRRRPSTYTSTIGWSWPEKMGGFAWRARGMPDDADTHAETESSSRPTYLPGDDEWCRPVLPPQTGSGRHTYRGFGTAGLPVNQHTPVPDPPRDFSDHAWSVLTNRNHSPGGSSGSMLLAGVLRLLGGPLQKRSPLLVFPSVLLGSVPAQAAHRFLGLSP